MFFHAEHLLERCNSELWKNIQNKSTLNISSITKPSYRKQILTPKQLNDSTMHCYQIICTVYKLKKLGQKH